MNATDPTGLTTYNCTSGSDACPGTFKVADLKRGDVIKTDGYTFTVRSGGRTSVTFGVSFNPGFENGRSAAATGPILIPPSPAGANTNENIRQGEQHSNNPLWFFNSVKNKGPMDYKQQGSKYEPYGNFNYGAVGSTSRFFNRTGIQQGWLGAGAGWDGGSKLGCSPRGRSLAAAGSSRHHYGSLWLLWR